LEANAVAQSTSDLSRKHQTSEISLKTSDLMLKHQKWQHCWQTSIRDDHGAGVPEWTPAGVCILGWSRSRSQHL